MNLSTMTSRTVRRLRRIAALVAFTMLLSSCQLVTDVNLSGSIEPFPDNFAPVFTQVDDFSFAATTDCDQPAGDNGAPASGTASFDGRTFTVNTGVCEANNINDDQVSDIITSGSIFSMTDDATGEDHTVIFASYIDDAAVLEGQFPGEGANLAGRTAILVANSNNGVIVIRPGDNGPAEFDVLEDAVVVDGEPGNPYEYYGLVIEAPPVTPESIEDFVIQARADGDFSNGEANPVLNHLGQMQAFLDAGRTDKAQKKLDNLIKRAERNAGDPTWDALLAQLQAINPLG